MVHAAPSEWRAAGSMRRWLAAALLAVAPAASAYEDVPRKEGIVPPYERPVKRPMMQAALIVRGTIESVHLQPAPLAGLHRTKEVWNGDTWVEASREPMPLTGAFKAYTADRFSAYTDPILAGLWGFQMLRIRVDEVLAAEAGVSVKAGETIDLYVDGESWLASPNLIAFAERYVLEHEGTVSPWSDANRAFILSQHDVTQSLVYSSPGKEPCPGVARERGLYLLSAMATRAEVDNYAKRSRAPLIDETPDPSGAPEYSVSDEFGGGSVGRFLGVQYAMVPESPWECTDFMTLDQVGAVVRGAR